MDTPASPPASYAPIQENYTRVVERMDAARRAAGREPGSVRLVVVTKGHPADAIRAVVQAGARNLGENYVEEALPKMDALSGPELPELAWHMIGHVQSRKARPVSERFACVHSLDSPKLASRLDVFSGEIDKRLPVLLECNVSGEATKFGLPAWDEKSWPALEPGIEAIAALPHLCLVGLMTMAPYLDDPEAARPYFARLRRLQEFLAQRIQAAEWGELSMGMSGDYEAAIAEGATLVRIGTAIMGPRA